MQEEFIKCFTRAGHRLSSAEKRSIISYRDMGTFSYVLRFTLLLNYLLSNCRSSKLASQVS